MKRFIYAGYAAFLMGSIPIISIPQGTAWIGGSFVLWLIYAVFRYNVFLPSARKIVPVRTVLTKK